MKRHRCLKDLSRDHHHALVLARKATRAIDASEDQARALWDTVVSVFRSELEPHFGVEESVLLPALDATSPSLTERTRAEHSELRAFLAGPRTRSRLHSFGTLLREHVRFEEHELFPAAERQLDQGALDAVARASNPLASARQREK